jgi:alpha-L-rhamnosidase
MMKKQIFISILFLFIGNLSFAQLMEFESLTCNYQSNPIAIDSEQPLLSWIVNADGFNREQTAYQVLAASKPELLNEKEADFWNSGKVKSAQSAHIKYKGKKLNPTQKYWWKVKIWDEKGIAFDWSSVHTFETGLMNETNWGSAKWIGLSEDTRTSEHRFREYKTGGMENPAIVTSNPAGYFRNEITVEKEIESARAYICGLGYYELYINGEKTGDHVLDPAPSNYDKQAYYVSYDVTKQIKAGKNTLGIIVGNGFYGQSISWKNDPESERDLSYGTPAAQLLLKLTYTDGTRAEFFSDENWKNSTGPIVFDNVYGGDTYDARFEIPGWNTSGFDDSKWSQVKVITPEINKVSIQEMPPIRRLKELAPTHVFKSPVTGNWIVDFGQNIAGWVQITVNEKAGQVIKIIPTEALTQSGDNIYPGSTGGGANGMPQLLKYICKGGGPETWEPKFSYHGFRYAQITGVSGKPDADMIKAVLVANDVEQKGNFVCSDPLLNKMDTISRWTIVDNLHGIPEDCPHREKCGWLGDAHAFGEYALYNYDLANFYKKYMEDIRTQMRPTKGENTDEQFNVPTMIAPGKRTSTIAKLDWGVATMYLPWYNYIYYGDSSIVLEYYDDMKELTNYYLTFKDTSGIIQNGMGDWCPPLWDRRQNPDAMECHPVVSANAYFYDVLGVMEYFAEMNGDVAFQQKMKKEKHELLEAFNKVYLETIPLVGSEWYGSQTATVMALQFGMVPEDKIESVVKGLKYNIEAVKGGHHSTGIHGNRYIYTVLNKYGDADLAHQILTTPTFPSQTYIMNYGFTTWPERQFFWEEMDGLTNSLNHPMHSGFAAYFYESLGGIKSSYDKPGYKEFTVKPISPESISSTTVNIPTPYGNIHNSWEKSGSNFSMELEVPFNTKARVAVSEEEFKSLKINGIIYEQFQKENKTEIRNNSELVLGSGEYRFEYTRFED